uniref:DiGeorge syndrome critical region 6 like n=1 Tax=Taeniopygia guttata TaxID=59729 RepID=A0A674HRT7_TAEGU
ASASGAGRGDGGGAAHAHTAAGGRAARLCAGAAGGGAVRERWSCRGSAGSRRPSSSRRSSGRRCCPGSRNGTTGFWPSCRRLSRPCPGLKQELFHRHKEAQQCCRPHNLPLLRAAQQHEMEAMEQQIREEQRMMDEKIVLELDQKVIDQQSTLEKAGVSGFYITTNPQELTLQMNLLELIRKLQQKQAEAEKSFS